MVESRQVAAERVDQRMERAGGALSGRCREARRRWKRLDWAQIIRWLRESDGWLETGRRRNVERGREHKQNRCDCGMVRIMTTRHGAFGQAGHFMTAVHRLPRGSGWVLVMVSLDRALPRRAAGYGVESPCGSGQRRIKKDDRNQAKRCEKRAPAVLMWNLHLRSKLPSIIR